MSRSEASTPVDVKIDSSDGIGGQKRSSLCPRPSDVRPVSCPSSLGIVFVSVFSDSEKLHVSIDMRPSSLGIEYMSRLLDRSKDDSRYTMFPSSLGMLPENELPHRLSEYVRFSMPSSVGSHPDKYMFDRYSESVSPAHTPPQRRHANTHRHTTPHHTASSGSREGATEARAPGPLSPHRPRPPTPHTRTHAHTHL